MGSIESGGSGQESQRVPTVRPERDVLVSYRDEQRRIREALLAAAAERAAEERDSQPASHMIQAAGGLVWRQGPGGRELALIHRRRYQDWSLPKGKLKNGESWQQAALREVLEETGCEALLGEFAGQIDYDVRGTPKRVMFWHMQAVDECQFYPNEEVDAIEWLPPDRALKRLTSAG